MTAKKYDITIEQGATFSRTFEWHSSSGGPALDVSSYSVRMQVRASHIDDTAVVYITSPNSGITLGGTNGRITCTIPASLTATLGVFNGVYDVEAQDIAGTVARLAQGKVVISPEVTR